MDPGFVGLIRRAVLVMNEDEEFLKAVKYFETRVELRQDEKSVVLDIRDGKVANVFEGPSLMGADIVVSAPAREWERIATGKTDWYQATTPGLGELTVSGNAVAAMRNVKAMYRLLEGVKTAGTGEADLAVEYSPEPKPSGKETVGRYMTVNGIRIFYEEAGEGQPIFCIHAACQDSLMYRYVLDGLSDEYRVIAVDAPGHAKSMEPESGPYNTLTLQSEFYEACMAALGLERPVIIGCSIGGNMVLELAARKPKAYAAVVSSGGSDYTPTVSQFLLDMLLENGQEIVECWSQSLTGYRTPPNRRREVIWQITRATPQAMNADLTGYANFDARHLMGKIECPVLLLRGDADWIVYQEMMEATQSRIPGSQMAVLRGTGHYPMIENPYEYNETVRAFLKGNGI